MFSRFRESITSSMMASIGIFWNPPTCISTCTKARPSWPAEQWWRKKCLAIPRERRRQSARGSVGRPCLTDLWRVKRLQNCNVTSFWTDLPQSPWGSCREHIAFKTLIFGCGEYRQWRGRAITICKNLGPLANDLNLLTLEWTKKPRMNVGFFQVMMIMRLSIWRLPKTLSPSSFPNGENF